MKELFNEICQNASLIGACGIVIKNGLFQETMCYGYSNLETKTLVNPYSVFRIASVSKTILALALMKLVEENKITINDDISKHLGFKVRNPYYPNDVITIKMLLTQTSSIMDGPEEASLGYNGVNGTNLDASLKSLLLEEDLYYTKETYDKNPPGTTFIYANFNCGILACIIEKVTNELFTEYIRRVVFLPLGLDASYRIGDIINQDIATLYYGTNEGIKVARTKEQFLKGQYKIFPLGENYRGPAGGLFISMSDLARLGQIFLNSGYPLLHKETISEMTKVHWQGKRSGSYQAKGLQMIILDDFGLRLYGHFGDAYGAKSYLLFNIEKQIAMVFITNGGYYKYQDSGICDIHEKLIKAFINEYA